MSLTDAVELYWIIECSECGETEDVPKEFCEDAAVAGKHFKESGWRDHLNGVMCKLCAGGYHETR